MVHIFHEPVRDYYDLDGLWREAIEVPVPEDNPAVHKG
jgi:ribosome-associated protein